MGVAIIPRAYPNNDMGDIVTLNLRGRLAKIMTLTSPEVYIKYV